MAWHRNVVGLILIGLVIGFGARAQEKAKPEKKQEEHQQGKAAVKGAVVGLQGQPIPGAQLTFQLEDTVTVTVQTDEKGEFFIDNVTPGIYTVKVEKPGYKTFIETQKLEPDTLLTYRVTLPTEEEAKVIRGGDDWKQANEAFKQAQSARARGDLQQAAQYYQTAKAYFQKVVEQDPTYAQAYFNLALTQAILGECEAALQNFQRAVDQQFQPSGNVLLTYHAARAQCFERLNRWADAAAEYEALIKLMPDNGTFYLNIGQAYVRSEQYDKALEAYRKFLQLEPNAPEAKQVRVEIDKLKQLLEQQKKPK
ncbi:Photosystem I assembly protein Ycf3 [bacterium HR11]|nr:Photosystem I assembly protein Ycf3 [bacterium HR11]